ncbi:MAG: peptide deformylase, partial [Candidatus Omnitrophica bacterium]|nr:peptide deformylase [Candidatus Omnitrophota bacterium]
MSEIKLEIKLLGDPVLRRKAKPVKEATQGLRDILAQMSRMMYEASGIGLAAPQVGVNKNMIIADVGSGLYKLINPKILKKEGTQALEEGCLSIPNVCIKVRRAKKVRLSAQDEFGKPVLIEAEDLLACVFQHEIDHLRGKLIVDYASFFDRLKMKKKLKELSRKGGIPQEAARERGKVEDLPQSETKSCK